jgi:hypothetical protein
MQIFVPARWGNAPQSDRRRYRRIAALGSAILISAAAGAQQAPSQPAPAQAPQPVNVNINITPKRLTLDRANNSATVYVFNQGSAPATVDVALVERVMLTNGEIKAAADLSSDQRLQPLVQKLSSAQPFVVAAPRRVTLAPGKGQTIRVRATVPQSGVAEYRTHLTVTTIPPRDTGVTADQAASAAANQLSFRITSVFGLSIPIIVRQGNVDARGAIEEPKIHYAGVSPDGVAPPVRTAIVNFNMRRLGANSLFGNVEIRSANKELLGLARGVGVYPEIDFRTLQIPLRRAPRPNETLEITFTDDDSSSGRVIARATLQAS